MARAGWCGQCGAYVYLTANDGCPSGHGPEWISNHYEVPDSPEVPVASGVGPSPTAAPVVTVDSPVTIDNLVAEASKLADEVITVTRTADGVIVQSDSVSGGKLVEILDRALALKPDDPDLLIAKSDALAHAMQFKSAEDVVDELLVRDPDNFEARMRKEHWGEWSSVFTLPHWSGESTVLAPSMRTDIDRALSIQAVRAGVKPVMAVLRPVKASEMASGLNNQTRSIWEPVWSQTPAGAIVVHYALVEDDPSSPYRAEAFLSLERPEKAARMNGYWALKQLSHTDGCFIVLVDGDRVLYNHWLPFPAHVKAHLAAMEDKLDTETLATGTAGFQQAMQWHMNAFDMDQVVFGHPLSDQVAGVSGTTAAVPVEVAVAAPQPAPTTEPAVVAEPVPEPTVVAQSAPEPAIEVGHLRVVDGLLGNPALTPQMRAVLLLNLCKIAEEVAPDMLDAYWVQLTSVAASLPKEHATAYKELNEELGEGSGKEAAGAIPALLAEVAAAKAMLPGDRGGATNALASVEARLGERKMPFGKKRVYAALGDAWLGLDRGQVIRLFGLTSQDARDQLIKRMHAQQALTQDEWRMLSGVLKPTQAARLVAQVLKAGQTGLHLPSELVPTIGDQLKAGISVQPVSAGLKDALDAIERFVVSLSTEKRCDEAWAELEKIYMWATTVPVQQLGNVFLRFAIIERTIRIAASSGCLSEERFVARVAETPAHLQAFARAIYRALVTEVGGVEAGYRRLEQELSPQALQSAKRKKWGPDPAKMAEAGHRAAALTLYLVRVAQQGLAKEALAMADRLGDSGKRGAIVRTLLSAGGDDVLELLPSEQFEEYSIERFLALGTAAKRAEYLARVTGNGARPIPGRLWRNWDAAQAMPQVRKGLLSGEMIPRAESMQEYRDHNPVFGLADLPAPGSAGFDERLFLEYVRTGTDFEYTKLDAALLPALVAWSERDWEPARSAMVWMWEAMKPNDMVLQNAALREGVLKRAFGVLGADPEVIGSYVLPWVHDELVRKGRTWVEGKQQFTLRLSDDNVAALCIEGALALAGAAPLRRDRLVEIVLSSGTRSADMAKTYAQVYMMGRPLDLVAPPVQLAAQQMAAWQEGVVLSIVNELRKQLFLAVFEQVIASGGTV